MKLKPRIERLESRAPLPQEQRITEIRWHIINPDRTPALNPDGSPMVIIKRVDDPAR